MGYPSVILLRSEESRLSWDDDLTNLSHEELQTFLLESQRTTSSIEAELQRRSIPTQNNVLKYCYERLEKASRHISVRKRLDDKAVDSAHYLRKILTTNRLNEYLDRKAKVCNDFFSDVAKQVGCELALLCVIALGKNKIGSMKEDERDCLLVLLGKQRKRWVVDELTAFVETHGLHVIADPECASDSITTRKRTWHQAFPSFEGQYCSFSFVSRTMSKKLPELFRSGMETSNLWRDEEARGGLKVTNCLSLYLPEAGNEDAFFVARVGYQYGFIIANLYKFGEPDVSVFDKMGSETV